MPVFGALSYLNLILYSVIGIVAQITARMASPMHREMQDLIDSGVWASNSHMVRQLFSYWKLTRKKVEQLELQNYHYRRVLYGQANRNKAIEGIPVRKV